MLCYLQRAPFIYILNYLHQDEYELSLEKSLSLHRKAVWTFNLVSTAIVEFKIYTFLKFYKWNFYNIFWRKLQNSNGTLSKELICEITKKEKLVGKER